MSTPEVVTFGCRLNAFESEVMRNHASNAGLDGAIIFNTCAVTAEATRQARQAIRRKRREQPDAKLIVTGCAAQIDANMFANMPEVDRVIGNEEKLTATTYSGLLADDAEPVRVNDIMEVTETAGHLIEGLEGRARAFVQVQNGCDHRCTFCVIPYGRGNSRSVPMGSVIEQIRKLVDNGYAEVVLTGVDITSYGADLPGDPSLGTLCQKILTLVPDLSRLRLTSIDSIEVDGPLLDVITTEPRLMPHLHLSLQSGDNMILKRMKRRHSREDAIRFTDAVRAARPDVVFGADFITGFPTETEEMFENTLRQVDECSLTYLHVFPFSAREGTPAAKMPQVPGNIRKERAARLRAKGAEMEQAYFTSLAGKSARILIEKSDETGARGHTESFAPVLVDTPLAPGKLVDATVTGFDGTLLRGTLSDQVGAA